MYGLRQSGRLWNLTLTRYLLGAGWRQFVGDANILERDGVLIGLYVDDFLCVAKTEPEVAAVFRELSDQYRMKDLGAVSEILGLEVKLEQGGYSFAQSSYIKSLERKYKDLTIRPKQPLPVGEYNRMQEGVTVLGDNEHSLFRSIVGELHYVANASRPDMLFTANYLGRSTASPTDYDLHLARYALGFLLRTGESKLNLVPLGSGEPLSAYCDASYSSGTGKSRNEDAVLSTTGYVVFLFGCAVQWRSSKQRRTATSTAEAELAAIHQVSEDVETIRTLLLDVGFGEKGNDVPPTTIYSDSSSAVAVIGSGVIGRTLMKRAREIRSVVELVGEKKLGVQLIPGEIQRADILTKGLPASRHDMLAGLCGVELIHSVV